MYMVIVFKNHHMLTSLCLPITSQMYNYMYESDCTCAINHLPIWNTFQWFFYYTSEPSWIPVILVKLSCFIFKCRSKSANEQYLSFYVAIAKGIHLVVELEEDNQTSHLHDTFIPDLNQLGTINTLFFSSRNDILETDIHTDFVVIIPICFFQTSLNRRIVLHYFFQWCTWS